MNDDVGLAQLSHLPGFYEPFSAISHLFGAVLFLILGGMLLRRGRGDRTRMTLLGGYVASSVLLMSMSAVYHMVERGGTAHRVFERLDHASIVIFIAGTFTAAHGLVFARHHRWLPLGFVWVVAVTGVTLRSIFFDDLPEEIGLAFYLALGWVGFASVVVLWRRYSFSFVALLLWGGLAYTIGAVAEVSALAHPSSRSNSFARSVSSRRACRSALPLAIPLARLNRRIAVAAFAPVTRQGTAILIIEKRFRSDDRTAVAAAVATVSAFIIHDSNAEPCEESAPFSLRPRRTSPCTYSSFTITEGLKTSGTRSRSPWLRLISLSAIPNC